jgi:monoamine oxidase
VSRKTIEFAPPLPAEKQDLQNGMYMGCAVKCIMVFNKAFWTADDSANPVTFGKLETLGPIANLFPTTVQHC